MRWRSTGLRIAVVALIHSLVLLGLIASRQIVLATGTRVVLQTAPVDPRSLFQGDYVVLRYQISRLDLPRAAEGTLPVWGDPVWVVLAPDGEVWRAEAVLRRPPEPDSLPPERVVVQGRVEQPDPACTAAGPAVPCPGDVTYGIEAFFVPEGEGRAIEDARNEGRVTVEVAVDRRGTAVITALLIDGEPVWRESLF